MIRGGSFHRGVGLLELLVTLTLFSVLALLAFLFLNHGVQANRRLDSSSEAARNLRIAQRSLSSDLVGARSGEIVIGEVPDQVGGGGKTGQAIAFRSAWDPVEERYCQKSDGTPFWQKTILYYAAVPTRHDSLYGMTCQGGSGPGGFDDACPHKILIRKTIDQAPTTTASSAEGAEEPMPADITSYLTRPDDLDLSGMSSEPDLVEARVVASKLLYFRVSSGVNGEVEVDLRALAIAEARGKVRVGEVSLADNPLTLQQLFTVRPGN